MNVKLFIALTALAVAGCASFDGRGLVSGKSTQTEVEALMGVPAERVKAASGDTVLYYPRQPTGRMSYAARIAPDSVLRSVDQLLTEPNIANIVRGVSTRDQVREIGGPPWRITRKEPQQREVWEYTMINMTQWDYFLYVQFSNDGIVREVMMLKDYKKEMAGPGLS